MALAQPCTGLRRSAPCVHDGGGCACGCSLFPREPPLSAAGVGDAEAWSKSNWVSPCCPLGRFWLAAWKNPCHGVNEAGRCPKAGCPTGRNLLLHLLPPAGVWQRVPCGSGVHPAMRGPSPEEEEHGPASPSQLGRAHSATCQEKTSPCSLWLMCEVLLRSWTSTQHWLRCMDPVQGWKRSTRDAASASALEWGTGESHCRRCHGLASSMVGESWSCLWRGDVGCGMNSASSHPRKLGDTEAPRASAHCSSFPVVLSQCGHQSNACIPKSQMGWEQDEPSLEETVTSYAGCSRLWQQRLLAFSPSTLPAQMFLD